MHDQSWFILRTKPGQESRAAWHLNNQSIEVYNPTYQDTIHNYYQSREVIRSLFAGYLFASFNLEENYSRVSYTRGVRGLLKFGDGLPVGVPQSVIDEIRARENESGFIRMFGDLFPGDEVVITENGPLFGLTGVFQRTIKDGKRIRILLNAISGQFVVELNRSSVRQVQHAAV